MTDRYEFTAADGSRRWCSQELLGAERFTETCGHFRTSGDYCGTCSALRIRSLALLKPKPTGLRWVMCKSIQYRWILELDGYPWGAVVWCWGEWLAGVRVYRALRYVHWVHRETVAVHVATGSLSACAHALVKAVKEKR